MKTQEPDAEMTETQEDQDDYELKLKFLNNIAKPVANKKLVKRLFKCIKKGNFIFFLFQFLIKILN
jgi:hypothetical protein